MSEQTPSSIRGRRAAIVLVALTAVFGVAYGAHTLRSLPIVPAALPPLSQMPSTQGLEVATTDGISLITRLDRTRVQRSDGIVRAELTLAAERPEGDLPMAPTDVVVVLDCSSSMSGQKFVDAKAALDALLGRLRPEDRLSVVTYDTYARVAVALAPATATAVSGWREAFRDLRPGGSTNISEALDLAGGVVQARADHDRPARVLLLSDGEPTAGDTSPAGLVTRARRAAEQGYVLSAVGIGLGFNEVLMAGLADAGTGNFHSLVEPGGLDSILTAEFDASRATVASSLAVELRPAPGVRVVEAAGYPLERAGEVAVFRPGSLFAGQTRTVWVTLQAPTDRVLTEADLGAVAVRFVREGQAVALPLADLGAVSTAADEAAFVAGIDKKAWETSVVAGRFAEVEKQLAVYVRNGEAEAAQRVLNDYAMETAALNRGVGSAAVTQHLVEVGVRQKALDDAFTGANQAEKRNRFSKMNLSSGWNNSRGGALGNVGGR